MSFSLIFKRQKTLQSTILEKMSSPPDYDAEHTPLITDVSDVDDSQMCKQLLRWLDENNLGNQDLISVSSLKDGLKKTALQAVCDNGKTGSFGYNKVHLTTRF